MRVKITKPGIFGAKGEIPVGTEVTVKDEPKGWAGRYEVITGNGDDKAAITNPSHGEREELKKQADELGIEYAKNVSNAKLQELIDAKLAE